MLECHSGVEVALVVSIGKLHSFFVLNAICRLATVLVAWCASRTTLQKDFLFGALQARQFCLAVKFTCLCKNGASSKSDAFGGPP